VSPATPDPPEHRGWYETWLDEVAGRRVATGRIALIWFSLVGGLGGIGVLLGATADQSFIAVAMYSSVPYWFIGVPLWLARRRRRPGRRG